MPLRSPLLRALTFFAIATLSPSASASEFGSWYSKEGAMLTFVATGQNHRVAELCEAPPDLLKAYTQRMLDGMKPLIERFAIKKVEIEEWLASGAETGTLIYESAGPNQATICEPVIEAIKP